MNGPPYPRDLHTYSNGCGCTICELVRDKAARRADVAGDRWTWSDLAISVAMIAVMALFIALVVRGWQ